MKRNADSETSAPNANVDPYKARVLEHPVSDWGTLAHVVCACLGTGTLAMPVAFSNTGLVLGIFTTIATAIISTHCAHILVHCAHELHVRSGKSSMSFAEVVEEACLSGPDWSRGLARYARMYVVVGIFLIYFSICSCYFVMIADNIQKVLLEHASNENWIRNARIVISLLLVPFLILAWVPNLKYLAPVSLCGTIFMSIGLAMTISFLVKDCPPISERALSKNLSGLPVAISIIIFAIGTIGNVMPLQNHMKNPLHFGGYFGVFNQGMCIVTSAYIVLGFLGYLKYGENVRGVITLNLPVTNGCAQAVMIIVSLAIYCSFGQMFYICTDKVWFIIKDQFSNSTLVYYILRTILVVLAALLAITVPKIIPFVGLIGALFFSTLGLLCPICLELVTFWGQGFGKYNWKILRNIVVILLTLIALILGSLNSIQGIIKIYQSD